MPNNAVVWPIGAYVPIKDYEIVNEEKKIWKGTVVQHPQMKFKFDIIYFRRDSNPQLTEFDVLFPEYEFPIGILDVPFLYVPKEKLLFGYTPAGIIQIADVTKLGGAGRPMMQ